MITVTYLQLFTYFLLTISSVCAIMGVYLSVKALIAIEGLKNSTHKVEMVPMDHNWATSDKDIADFNEKSESVMPIDQEMDTDFESIDLKKMI